MEFGFWILGPESQIQNPKSPIQTFLAKFSGFWLLDFGSLCSNSLCEAPTPHILDFGGDFEFWILEVGDTGFWILGILDFGLRGFWILGILDFGFWGFWNHFRDFGDFGFLEHYVADLYVQSLDFGIWGFWILDFGDFGFWILGILDFGFWRFLEFGGLGILDWQVVTKFWMLHKRRRLCTPTGSADLCHMISQFWQCCNI